MKYKYIEALEELCNSNDYTPCEGFICGEKQYHLCNCCPNDNAVEILKELVEKATTCEKNINIFKTKAKQEIKKITFIDNSMIIEGKDGAIHRFYGDGLNVCR